METGTDDQSIGFYDQDDIAFYYDLAQKFAINDRYFASVLGPTLSQSLVLEGRNFFRPSHHQRRPTAPTFNHSPSQNTAIGQAEPPTNDCTP